MAPPTGANNAPTTVPASASSSRRPGMSPSWRRASTSHAMPPAAIVRVTTSTGSQIDHPVTSAPATGTRASASPTRAVITAITPERLWRGANTPIARTVAASATSVMYPADDEPAKREQALAGEQQADGRDERCGPSGSGDEREPVHARSLNRSAAPAIGLRNVLMSFLRRICASTARSRPRTPDRATVAHGRDRRPMFRRACPPTVDGPIVPLVERSRLRPGSGLAQTQVGAVVRPRRVL